MRIAIVGAGVSGLVAAHLLHERHEIVVFEERWVAEVEKALAKAEKVSKEKVDSTSFAEVKDSAEASS